MEYDLNVKDIVSSSSELIKCLCVPKICLNIKGQSVKQELMKHDFIKALKLAHASISLEYLIDMLIGSDICWDFVTGEMTRSLYCGPTCSEKCFRANFSLEASVIYFWRFIDRRTKFYMCPMFFWTMVHFIDQNKKCPKIR